ncbi:MAG: hypothetical protein IH600_14215 [Bacteroidetes bacterium]|nr:hypothetical protein [Bacteroidota bacterium]
MTGRTKRPPESGRRTLAVFLTLALHLIVLIIATLIQLHEPHHHDPSVRLWFRSTPQQTSPAAEDQRPSSAAGRRENVSDAVIEPPQSPPRTLPLVESEQTVHADVALDADTSSDPRRMTLRSVLDRKIRPDQAWEILARLLEEYPEYKNMIVKEMIAGTGLPADSLPRINLYLDQIFKNGIQPTWGTQRGAIEGAWKSFDPVMGWTNKGGYGPQINVLGLLKFLIDLIEGK